MKYFIVSIGLLLASASAYPAAVNGGYGDPSSFEVPVQAGYRYQFQRAVSPLHNGLVLSELIDLKTSQSVTLWLTVEQVNEAGKNGGLLNLDGPAQEL